MKNINTADATGAALDWLVAKALGLNSNTDPEVRTQYVGYAGFADANGFGYDIKNYSTDWSQGGPIIADNALNLHYWVEESEYGDEKRWESGHHNSRHRMFGPTPLIAAMRCFVASKLGDIVEVPEELT